MTPVLHDVATGIGYLVIVGVLFFGGYVTSAMLIEGIRQKFGPVRPRSGLRVVPSGERIEGQVTSSPRPTGAPFGTTPHKRPGRFA